MFFKWEKNTDSENKNISVEIFHTWVFLPILSTGTDSAPRGRVMSVSQLCGRSSRRRQTDAAVTLDDVYQYIYKWTF